MSTKINSKKLEMFDLLKKFIDSKQNIFFLDYRGLSVSQLTDLRNKIEGEHGALKVVKNNIMKMVLKEKNIDVVDSCLVGPTVVVTALEEANVIAKIFYDFVKTTTLKVKGGFVLGEFMMRLKFKLIASFLPKKSLFLYLLVC